MTSMRISLRALGAAMLFAGFGLNPALALPPAPKAEDMAKQQPKQAGVEVTVLAPADLAKCRVEPFPNAQNPVGYVLFDSSNRPVRRFVAVNTPGFNIFSYYLDGEEVYRETDSKGAGKADQFRWLGSNGGKIGRDLNGDSSIDTWDVISPEEVSKELFDAIATNDANRLKALMPTDAELKGLGLPAAEIAAMQARMTAAAGKLAATATATGITPKAKWEHVEFFLPETRAFDSFGGNQDLVRHRNGGVLYLKDEKNAAIFSTGEIVKVGNAWRVIDGPAPNQPEKPTRGGPGGPPENDIPPAIQPLVAELVKISDPGPGAGQMKYHMDRAAVLEKIVTALNGMPAQQGWMRQLLDAHAAAAELGDKGSYERLTAWAGQINKHAPKTPLAAFSTFRLLGTDYVLKLKEAGNDAKKMDTVQKWWRDELESFVKAYPNAEETPEALYRLAMAHEFNGKIGEQNALVHYTALAKGFPQHPLAAQAAGAANRLGSEGKLFTVAGCTDLKTGAAFNPAGLNGKVVVVYFWGSFAMQGGTLKSDAAAFDALLKKHGNKLEVLTICLDNDPKTAVAAINATQLPGTHLTSPGGAMATNWGIMGQHMFLLDKTGKVENKNANAAQIGDEIEKLVK